MPKTKSDLTHEALRRIMVVCEDNGLAGEISHRLKTLQAELANEISRLKSSTALPNHHIFLLTEMLERSKVSDPPTLQLRDPADAPSAFKIAAQPETDVDFRQRLIDHVISPSVQDCEDMGWVTGAALDAIGLKYGLKRRGLSSDTQESAPTPVPISEMHLHFHPPAGSVLNAIGNIVQIEPQESARTRLMLDPGTLPKAGEFADVRVEVIRCSDDKIFFKSDDGTEAYRRYGDIVLP